MTEKYRSPFPEHALAEMKKDPAQRAFWERWAAVGDAKLDFTAAFHAVTAAEEAWRECRAKAGMIGQPGMSCGCGKHADLYTKTLRERDKTSDGVQKQIAAFKRGKP